MVGIAYRERSGGETRYNRLFRAAPQNRASAFVGRLGGLSGYDDNSEEVNAMSGQGMTNEEEIPDEPATGSRFQPFRVRLPGFVSDEDIGLGDAISRISYAAGIQPCGGCARRAAALNRWMVFTR